MNMCIIMVMNIYISKANEAWLRSQATSMSGIINSLLDDKRGTPRKVGDKEFQRAVDSMMKVADNPNVHYEVSTTSNYTPPTPVTQRNKDLQFCKHGQVKGLCKKGCK